MPTLLARFQEQFLSRIARVELSELHASWASDVARTVLYRKILGDVAEALKLKFEPELLIVDFAMIAPVDRVPQIFIESENAAWSAVQEVRKLCCIPVGAVVPAALRAPVV